VQYWHLTDGRMDKNIIDTLVRDLKHHFYQTPKLNKLVIDLKI